MQIRCTSSRIFDVKPASKALVKPVVKAVKRNMLKEKTIETVKGYQTKMKPLVSLLEKLNDKFLKERAKLEKQEAQSVHAHRMLVQALTKQLANSRADKDRQTAVRMQLALDKTTAMSALREATTSYTSTKLQVKNLKANCDLKASDYYSRQLLRSEELRAVKQAIDIIQRDLKGHAGVYKLIQRDMYGTSLAQVGSSSTASSESEEAAPRQRTRALEYLQERAHALDSKVLAAALEYLEKDSFLRVRQLINTLIVRLMQDTAQEADHKTWCDAQLATNVKTRQAKTFQIEAAQAQIEGAAATLEKLSQSIDALNTARMQTSKALVQAATQRAQEQAKNQQALFTAQDGQKTIANALAVLNEFYAKARVMTSSLLQQDDTAAEAFAAPYRGMQKEHGGVIGVLQVVQGDFARLQVQTE
eukprot:NODE_4792_length_1847_cov_1.630814.p2 GENE.NODE_4792_length_1847_cov_1.630814~~NODE_4792_length_1847_cov_1.630814.p2  ORF type:complete len:418 (-),score=140.80 NODE_4792_length_1847_cov_1.630814:365-1618(-)